MLGRGAAAAAPAAGGPQPGLQVAGSAAGLGFLPFPGALGMAVAGHNTGGSNSNADTTLGAAPGTGAGSTAAGGGAGNGSSSSGAAGTASVGVAGVGATTGPSAGRPASGSSDMRYRGVIRMRGMPYR